MTKRSKSTKEYVRRQKSVFFYRDAITTDENLDFRSSLYANMLSDDISNRILPISLGEDTFSVYLKPENHHFQELIAKGISHHDYYVSRTLSEAVKDFFRRVATNLTLTGKCVYEIVDLIDDKSNDIKAFDLSFIQPDSITQKRNGKFEQHIPSSVARERKVGRIIPLDAENLLIFQLQEPFQKGWLKLMKELASLSEITPKFAQDSFLSTAENNVPFDYSEYSKAREQTVAMLTRDIGWNMGKFPHDGMLEYYWIYRKLKFELFIIELRESILATLNDSLKRIGKKLDMSGEIIIDGLLTVEDVLQAQDDLTSGRCYAGDILDKFPPG